MIFYEGLNSLKDVLACFRFREFSADISLNINNKFEEDKNYCT